jgi:hypothetical protein
MPIAAEAAALEAPEEVRNIQCNDHGDSGTISHTAPYALTTSKWAFASGLSKRPQAVWVAGCFGIAVDRYNEPDHLTIRNDR